MTQQKQEKLTLSAERFQQLLDALRLNEQEQIVLVESFVYSLPPQAILLRHTDCFADIESVYDTKRRVMIRIQQAIGSLQF